MLDAWCWALDHPGKVYFVPLTLMPYILNRSKEHLPEDVFEVARLRKQVPIRRPASHTTAAVNMQNLQEFNLLKYRGKCDRISCLLLEKPLQSSSVGL